MQISIHAPLTGSDPCVKRVFKFSVSFQSTLPLRGATLRFVNATIRPHYFNPRSPYGERLLSLLGMIYPLTFQSTLPLRGATNIDRQNACSSAFQSTLPLRGATFISHPVKILVPISIHAPLTGSDPSAVSPHFMRSYFNPRSPYGERPFRFGWSFPAGYFNPRSPYGERLMVSTSLWSAEVFQSTLPLRGATIVQLQFLPCFIISIHAPLTGSDFRNLSDRRSDGISIHAPLTGSDLCSISSSKSGCLFQSTLPLRGATSFLSPRMPDRTISIHAPLTGSDYNMVLIP